MHYFVMPYFPTQSQLFGDTPGVDVLDAHCHFRGSEMHSASIKKTKAYHKQTQVREQTSHSILVNTIN